MQTARYEICRCCSQCGGKKPRSRFGHWSCYKMNRQGNYMSKQSVVPDDCDMVLEHLMSKDE